MSIKRILLPACATAGLEPIADAAFTLGHLLGAQVRTLFAQPFYPLYPPANDATSPEMMHWALEQAANARLAETQQARQIFDRCAGRSPQVDGEFAVSDGIVSKVVSRAARLADISVVGSGTSYGANGWEDVREGALFGSGRPVLLAPPARIEEHHFERIVIAWKDGVEAARAIAAVQPFLLLAKEAYLITVGEEEPSVASLQNVEQYLQLHHSEVRSESLPESGKSVGEVLIEKCNDLGAMLAMGAYSHWRWQERIFGGVTDHVLRQAQTPVLMAH